MDDLQEEYKKKIIEIINEIEDVRVLIWLDTFIKELIKAGPYALPIILYLQDKILCRQNHDVLYIALLSFLLVVLHLNHS